MQPNELFHAVTQLFPRSFKPREHWRESFLEEVFDWTESERMEAFKVLKRSKSAASAICLEDLRRARDGQLTVSSVPAVKRYPLAWLNYMRDRGLLNACRAMGDEVCVYTSRLVGILWVTKPASWQQELDTIVDATGAPEDRIWQLYSHAKRMPDCQTRIAGGWSFSERIA